MLEQVGDNLVLVVCTAPVLSAVITFTALPQRSRYCGPAVFAQSIVLLGLMLVAAFHDGRPTGSHSFLWLARHTMNEGGAQVTGIDVRFSVALDETNSWALVLVHICVPAAILMVWRAGTQARKHYALIMVFHASVCLALLAGDAIVFIASSGMSSFLAALLVGQSGDVRRRHPASHWFFIQHVGHLALLAGAIGLCLLQTSIQATGAAPFAFENMASALATRLPLDGNVQQSWFDFEPWLLGFLTCGMLLRLPLPPWHGIFVHCFVAASASTRVILCLNLALAAFAVMRFWTPLIPIVDPLWHEVWATFGVASIVYGALLALASHSRNRRLGACTVSQVGFWVTGLTTPYAAGQIGAVVLITNYLLSMSLSALGTDGGSSDARTSPAQCKRQWSTWLAFMSLAGTPGLAGFVGMWMVTLSVAGTPIRLALVLFGAVSTSLAIWTSITSRANCPVTSDIASPSKARVLTAVWMTLLAVAIVGLSLHPTAVRW